MNYEKKYKEVLERAKGLLDGMEEGGYLATLEDIKQIFPELKESEEEKIERILHSISSKMSANICNIFTEEEFQCFDAWSNIWLKKQGNKIWTNNDYDKVKGIEYLLHELDNHNFDDWFNSLKQKLEEQK